MKKTFTAEEKKAYYAEQKQAVEKALTDGVKAVYTSDNYMNFLNIMSQFHNYSVNNCILIAMQKPEATRVAGFNDWKKKFHRTVKKGEKAIKILAPMPCKFTTEVDDLDGNKVEKQIEFMRYKLVSVFDYSQTEGEELPTICNRLEGNVQDFDELFAKLKQIAGIPVEYEDIQNGASGYYSPQENRIAIKSGMSEAQTIKTLVHEITHSILHNDVFCDTPREIKEIQAESTAYMVCNGLGINTADYSFEYVATWAKEDMKKLNDQMAIIRKTADAIISKLFKKTIAYR